MTTKKPIQASESVEGKIYATKLGVPVLVKKIGSSGVQIVTAFSDKLLTVKKNSPLFFCPKKKLTKKVLRHFNEFRRESRLTSASKLVPAKTLSKHKAPRAAPARRGPKGPQGESVRAILDPLLIAGVYTMRQMADKLSEAPISKLLANKDLRWYVSDRMYGLKKTGYTIEKLESGAIRATRTVLLNPVIEKTLEVVPVSQPSSLLSRLARFGKEKI